MMDQNTMIFDCLSKSDPPGKSRPTKHIYRLELSQLCLIQCSSAIPDLMPLPLHTEDRIHCVF